MKPVHFVCVCLTLAGTIMLGQFVSKPSADQVNGLPIAQQRHPALPPNLFHMPQGAPFAQRGARALNATMNRRQALPMQGGLNFANAVAYGSGGNGADSVAVADVNGDGKLDLVVANGGSIGVLLGNGDGTFQTAVTYGSGGSSVAVADVNGDGKPDLVVATACADSSCVGVLLGNGDGTFQTEVTYGSGGYGATSVAVADVNGDGKPDLVVANYCVYARDCGFSGMDGGDVGVLLGNGDGTFQTAVTYGSGGYDTVSVAVADVNGDGKPDLMVASCAVWDCNDLNGSVGVLLGNGDGTFQAAVTYGSSGYFALSVAVADVNGDGKPDLLVANNCVNADDCFNGGVGVLLGNGNGTFQTAVAYGSGGSYATSVAVADVNGDGKPDLLVASCVSSSDCTNGGVGVLLGNGDGTFQAAVAYGSGGYGAWSVAVADVNGDGKPDLLVANECVTSNDCTTGSAGVLLNTSLTPTTTALTSSQNPSRFGQPVTFTATVTAQQGFCKGTPTGTVSFYDGATNIGNSNLNSSGVATLTTSTLPAGTDSITATYNGDTNCAPSTSPVLYQVVQGAVVSLSPTSLNFGNQTVGFTSSPQYVTLQNTGNINLTITSIQITGTNSGDFAQSNNCPSSVAPNGSCQISVTFTPTTSGTRNAAVSITDNAPGSPQSVPLTGVGVLPAATFSPTSLNFGNQTAGTTTSPQVTTLTNTGPGTLTITSIGIAGANSNEFGQTNNCPSSLTPNGSCNISVTFSPKALGVATAFISVADNAPGSPQTVPLTGTGVSGVSLSPPNVTFPNQYVGTSGLPQDVKLTNTGDTLLTITNVTASPADFAPLSTCGNSVGPGASCSIGVFFDPTTSGTRNGVLTITDSAINSPQTVPLTGMGQDFSVAPSSSSTATVTPGQVASYTVSVKPAGGFNQTVTLSCSGAPAQSSCSVSPSSVTLNGKTAAPVTVTVTTAGTSASLALPPAGNRLALWLAFSGLPGLLLLGRRPRKSHGLFYGLALLCVLCTAMTWSACGGGSSMGSSGGGTAPGTYNLTVVGTFTSGSANLVHSTKLTLVVQ